MPTEDELLQQEIERARQMVPAAVLPTLARGSPDDGTRPGWLGLLGESLGGGQGAGYQLRGQEEDAAGSRALLNFGIQTLLASGPSSRRPDVLGSVAHGLQGAQQSLGVDQKRGQSRAESEYSGQIDRAKLAQMQSHGEVERLRTLIPLLKLQDDRTERRRIQNLPPPWQTSSDGSTGQPGQQGASVTPGPIEGDAQARALAVRDGLVKRGMDLPTATAFAANALHESIANPNTGPGDGGASRGLFMWQGPRREAYVKKYGHEPDGAPLNEQLDFVMHELNTSESLAQRRIAAVEGPEEKARIVSQAYLRPKDVEAEGARRSATARQLTGLPPTPTAATPRRPPLPPAADVAPTGAVVAGPGAQPGAVQPPSPEVAGNVAAMVRGMVGAGADPTTLSPGPGGGAGGAQVAQAGQGGQPDAVTPPGAFAAPLPGEDFDTYRKRNQVPPTPQQQQELAGIELAKRAAMTAWQAANTIADKNKASAEYAAAEKAKGEAIGKIGAANETRLFDIWKDANTAHRSVQDKIAEERRKAEADAAKADADHKRAIELANVQGDQSRQTEMAKTENSYVLTERKRFGEERDGSRAAIDDLQMLRALSQSAGTSTTLDNIVVGDRTARDYMVNAGLGTQAQRDKWGAQQAFEAAVNATVIQLRKGVSMGALTDRDLQFLQRMAPSLMQQPETRASIISMLEQAQHRKLQYTDLVEQLWDGGKGMSWGTAKREAQKMLPDYLPALPPDYAGWDAVTRQQWKDTNLRPGQLLRGLDGTLSVYQPQRRQ